MKFSLAVLVATLLASIPATAAPIFEDNFNGENGGNGQLNYSNFSKWDVLGGGSVDLIPRTTGGVVEFDFLPGDGLYVDLDGSTNNPGLLSTKMTFGPGSYEVTFSLAGSQLTNSTTETVTVAFGGNSEVFTLPSAQGLTSYTRLFTITTPSTLSFQNGGNDNIGALLDNVSVSVSVATIPEPATLAVFGGVALAGVFGCRRRKATA